LVALAFLSPLISCGDGTVSPPGGEATLAVRVNLSGTMVAMVVADVTAPDIPTMLVFNIPIVNGTATGTITVPAGSNRLITLRAYDAGGVNTHTGSQTVNIQPGTNATMSIVLTPLTGDVPIIATIGSFVVTVTPPSASLSVAGTAQLAATIKDADGNPTTGVVAWATHDPGIANVNVSGLVTASGVGTTTVSAVFQGVTGTASIVSRNEAFGCASGLPQHWSP
jgi:hypothetical protein